MEERRDFVNGLVVGASVGIAVGLLFAPEGGGELLALLRTQIRQVFKRTRVSAAVSSVSAALGDVKAGVQLGIESSDVRAGVELGVESASDRLRGDIEERKPSSRFR